MQGGRSRDVRPGSARVSDVRAVWEDSLARPRIDTRMETRRGHIEKWKSL